MDQLAAIYFAPLHTLLYSDLGRRNVQVCVLMPASIATILTMQAVSSSGHNHLGAILVTFVIPRLGDGHISRWVVRFCR